MFYQNIMTPHIQALEEDMKHDFKKYRQQVNDFILKNLGSEQKVDKYRLRNMEVSVGFFDTEIELIVSFFEVMRRLSPDMAVAYNASYDLRYLAARIEKAFYYRL
jgi:DNA polymerase elongation subunit (family B)